MAGGTLAQAAGCPGGMSGAGTSGSPCIIMTAAQLSDVNSDLSASYELGTNIDLGSYSNWTPIGESTAFSGTFNGAGHTISNLTIQSSGAESVGLFSQLSGTLENIGLDHVNINASGFVGSLVGLATYATITNAYATGSVAASGEADVGGLVAFASNTTITDVYFAGSVGSAACEDNCGGVVAIAGQGVLTDAHASGSVTGGPDAAVGGLIGSNLEAIADCYATATVSTGGDVDSYAGGLAGFSGYSITDSYATGNVSGGPSGTAGGLVGKASATITDVYATGNVTGGYGDAYVGGLVGSIEAVSIQDAYATGSVTTGSASHVGGLVGFSGGAPAWSSYTLQSPATAISYSTGPGGTVATLPALEQQATYSGWDFTNTWGIDAGSGLPYLRALAGPAVAFGTDGSGAAHVQSASTTVTVTDAVYGVDASSLEYAWTQTPETPPDGTAWTSLTNGATLARTGVTGTWYLHVQAADDAGRAINASSKAFQFAVPASVFVAASPPSLTANGTSASTVTASVYDADGDPLGGSWVSFSTSLGTLSGPSTVVTDNSGVATSTLIAGTTAGTATVTASVYGTSGSATATFTAGAPSRLTEHLSAQTVSPDGFVTVSGTVYDGNGNAVPRPAVTLTAPGGSFSTVSTTVYGEYSATLRAPASPGPVTVKASAGGATAETMLLVTPPGMPASQIAISPGQASISGLTATGAGGTGDVEVADYGGDPAGAPTFANGGYFDVALSAGNTFTSLTVERCGASAGQALYWWSGTRWGPVANPPPAFDPSTGCLSVTLTGTSAPSLAQVTGTLFAVGTPRVAGAFGGGLGTMLAVAAVAPDSGPAAGGTSVTITGTGFTSATAVDFGGTPAERFAVDSDGQITAVSPAGTGTVDVTVTTSSGRSATGAADRFTYRVPTAQAVPSAAFSDVPAGYWAAAAIGQLAGKGIVSGFPDGTFRPDEPVTRAQFVKMLVLTLGLQPGTAPTPFADVAPSAWYAPYVSAAVATGSVDGVTPTAFAPNATLTREQMAVLLARALKLTKTATLRFADDASIDAWALQGVQAAVAAGYIDGLPDGTLQPLRAATRAQAASVLALVLQHLPS